MNALKYNRDVLIILCLMSIGGFIRFYTIGLQTISTDELFTLSFVAPSIPIISLIIKTLTIDFTPPLFYIAAHYSMILFGVTVEAIRYPSAICGILLIPVLYFVGKEYRGRNVGLVVAAFTTICYTCVYYSKYGRAYSMELLFFTATFYYFLRLLKGDKHSGIGFATFAILTLWTHLFSAIPIGIMILYLLWNKRAQVEIFIIGLFSLPLINYIFNILSTRGNDAGSNNFGMSIPSLLFLTPLDILGYSMFVTLPILLWVIYKKRKEIEIKYIIETYTISIILMVLLSFKTPIIIHYIIYVLPFAILLICVYFYELYQKQSLLFYHLLMIMVIIILEIVQVVALLTIQRLGG